MSNTDWKEALGALLPDGYIPEPEEPQAPKKTPKRRLTVTLDKKRAGKTATIISGFDPDDDTITELAANIKRRLAVGGSARGGEILIQGDRVEAVKKLLEELWGPVK